MKYNISLDKMGCWHRVDTSFVITKILKQLIKNCKGVDHNSLFEKKRYSIEFAIGHAFTFEEVKENLSKIMDAYIAANPNAENMEDRSIREFAEEKQQFRFLKNYN